MGVRMKIGDIVYYKLQGWETSSAREQYGAGIIIDHDGYDKYTVCWSQEPRWNQVCESCFLELA